MESSSGTRRRDKISPVEDDLLSRAVTWQMNRETAALKRLGSEVTALYYKLFPEFKKANEVRSSIGQQMKKEWWYLATLEEGVMQARREIWREEIPGNKRHSTLFR